MADAVIRISGNDVRVSVGGAQGPRGLASGPLGAGSVDADTISDDSGEQDAVRAKIGAASVADIADVNADIAAVGEVAQRAAATSPATWAAPRVFDFTRFVEGERVNELKIYGSPTAGINGSAQLEVDNAYSDTTEAVFLRDFTFAEGMLRAKLVRDKFMLKVVDPVLGGYRALWSGDGTTLEVGYVDAGNNVTSIGTPNTLAGTGSDIIWVEMLVGPMANGLGVYARSWKDGDARPTTADVFGTFGSGVAGEQINEGYVSFSTFAGATSKYLRIEAYDGLGGTSATGNVTLGGLWFPGFEGGLNVMRSVRTGDSFRMRVTGTADIAIEFAGVSGVVGGYVPVGDAFVNGVRVGGPFTFTDGGTAGLHGLTVSLGLDPAVWSNVEIILRGVHEHNDKHLKAGGLALYRVTAASAGGTIAPWPDERPAMELNGDSTGEPVVVRGGTSTPTNAGGDISWLRKAADALGYKPIHNAFGGTGVYGGMNSGVAGILGSGGMPAVPISARNYMRGRLIDFGAVNTKIKMLVAGTNDRAAFLAVAHPTDSEWQAATQAYILQSFKDYPGLERFILIPSFASQFYKTQMQNIVTALADPRVTMFDTTTLQASLVFTDGVHPTLADQTTIANAVVAYIQALPAPTFS